LPTTTDTLVGKTTTDTLTNKTLTSPVIDGTPTGVGVLTSSTAQATTSGTSKDFTSIPSWVKRITVMFNGVSTNGTSNPLIQLGSGSVQTSSYLAGSTESGTVRSAYTTGFGLNSASSQNLIYAQMVITNVSGNIWLSSFAGNFNQAGIYYSLVGSGNVTLSSTLDRVRITTVNGTDTFDAGSINILYE
jgi:hypothetical protein